MPLFRCLNCSREFDAARPSCSACGLDPATNPRHTDLFVPLLLHHFDPPTNVPGIGKGHAACDPAIKCGRPGMMFTGEPGAVNCPKCKATEAFVAANGLSTGAVPLGVSRKQ